MLLQLLLCTLAKDCRDEQAHGCCTLFNVPVSSLRNPFKRVTLLHRPNHVFTAGCSDYLSFKYAVSRISIRPIVATGEFAVNTSGGNNCATVTPGQTDFIISQRLKTLVTVVPLAYSVR